MNPALLVGGAAILAGVAFSRTGNGHGLMGLGDEDEITPPRPPPTIPPPPPTPPGDPPSPGSFDPSRSNRTAYLRTHVAKKMFGSATLSAQAANSMKLLARRIRNFSPEAASQALAMSQRFMRNAEQARALAIKYDEPWVKYKEAAASYRLAS